MDAVLSFGAGINSTAMLLELVRRGTPPRHLVFADTGEERAETYMHLRGPVNRFCRVNGIELTWLLPPRPLVDYYRLAKAVPSIMRRDCTSKFKVDPIRRWLREKGIVPAKLLIGIALDEAHRVRDSDVKWVKNEFPLVDWGWTRRRCEQAIEDAGWALPVKSGCQGCPFAGRRGLVDLLHRDPEEFARWRRMEESGSRYPEITLVPGVRLDRLERSIREQRKLDAFEGGECLAGACSLDEQVVV